MVWLMVEAEGVCGGRGGGGEGLSSSESTLVHPRRYLCSFLKAHAQHAGLA